MDLKNGYYRVASEIFESKTLALVKATKTNSYVEWEFNKSVFDSVNWAVKPVGTLSEIYQRRARQLREKYDYLVLFYSGGSDSWTALKAMLDSDSCPDEIVTRWAFSAINGKYTPTSNSTDPSNIHSEWDLVVKHDLEWIRLNYPQIKITVLDYSDDFKTELEDDDFLLVNDHMQVGVFLRSKLISDGELDNIEKGKKTAVIYAVDKPQLAYKDDKLYFYFLDILANSRSAINDTRNCELFYWTPDMPDIVVAQSHAMLEFYQANPHCLATAEFPNRSPDNKKLYDKLCRSVVYPDWDVRKFQADKDSNMVFHKNDAWVYKSLYDLTYYKSWEYGLQNVFGSIDQKYFKYIDNKPAGLGGFISPLYYIGNLQPIS